MTANVTVIKNRTVFVAGWDLTAEENELLLVAQPDENPNEAFGVDTHTKLPGLLNVSLDQRGYTAYGDDLPDQVAFVKSIGQIVPVTVTPNLAAARDLAYFLNAAGLAYDQELAAGRIPRFSLRMAPGAAKLCRGVILSEKGNRATAYNSVGQELGLVAAGKHVYAALHVFGFNSGATSVTVKIQSDDNSGFTTATDQITFGPVTSATGKSGLFATPVAGAISDTFWRINVTVVGGGTVTLAVSFAIM